MSPSATVNLHRSYFTEAEKTLVEYDGLTASVFQYPTGVHGLRLTNQLGQIIVLPYQGQQIWDAQFHGRSLTMKSMFDAPVPTTDFLHTYGGFAIHCGAMAMGVPTEEDNHPLHGELPNAPYQQAQLLCGQDERGSYLGVTGTYRHTVAFSNNYVASPEVRLYANSSRLSLSMTVSNLKQSNMDLMYLAHVNFRPIDNGKLVYSAPCDPEHVRVRNSIPSHIDPPKDYRKLLQKLELHPEQHNCLLPGLPFDPEVVFFIDYQADEQGWAHSMQVRPDGSADFISHRPEQLNHGIRWISRTADQDALGLSLPATAEPEGYSSEKAKGNLKIIPPGGIFHCQMEIGSLQPEEADRMQAVITQVLAK